MFRKGKDGEAVRNTDKISDKVLAAEYEAVFRYVLALSRSEHDAQDITQETFLKAMESADKYKGKSSLYTYLCAIAKNLWINRCRKHSREYASEDAAQLADNGGDIEGKLAEKDMSMYVHKVLHGIKEPYKEVFSLRVFGQLPYADIAALFSKTESWARTTYHRARKMIIETLRKDGLL